MIQKFSPVLGFLLWAITSSPAWSTQPANPTKKSTPVIVNVTPGKWAITTTIDGRQTGVNAVPSETQYCVRSGDTMIAAVLDTVRMTDAGCHLSVTRSTAEQYRWQQRCENKASGASALVMGELTFLADRIAGLISITMPQLDVSGRPLPAGKAVTLTLSIAGKKIGECR